MMKIEVACNLTGYGSGVTPAQPSPIKKMLSIDHPNPALPITEVINYTVYHFLFLIGAIH